jgi:hypothetical protein
MDRLSSLVRSFKMDAQLLDGYFTNLVYEMEARRDSRFCGTDREDVRRDGSQTSRTHELVAWLTASAVVWLSIVAMGFWL